MIVFRVTQTGPMPREVRKQLPLIKKKAFMAAGRFWHRYFRPKHFTAKGAREYGYAPRKGERGSGRAFKGSYTARKLKRFGHTRPLVYTGESAQLARIMDVRGTSRGSRTVIHARGLNRRNPNSTINMRDEMTRISRGEVQRLTKLISESLGDSMDKIQTRKTETIR
ncbi:MAG: hypothetical protein ACPGXK_00220 [Phycisphaerae bacterium]